MVDPVVVSRALIDNTWAIAKQKGGAPKNLNTHFEKALEYHTHTQKVMNGWDNFKLNFWYGLRKWDVFKSWYIDSVLATVQKLRSKNLVVVEPEPPKATLDGKGPKKTDEDILPPLNPYRFPGMCVPEIKLPADIFDRLAKLGG